MLEKRAAFVSWLKAEFDSFELELERKLEKKEIDVEGAFEQYRRWHEEAEAKNLQIGSQHSRRRSMRDFLGGNWRRFKLIPMGRGFVSQFRIFEFAVFQSVPNALRKRIPALDRKLDALAVRVFKKLVVKVNGIAYSVRDYESLEIIGSKFEPFMARWFQLKPDDVFVDIGSHIGKYALSASRVVDGDGMVVAVEAHPSNFALLKQNIRLNKAGNVRAYNLAAWNEPGELKLFIGSNSATSNISRYSYGQGYIDVQSERMDKILVQDLRLKRVDWIKIDVEGAEYEVLLGLEETLSKYKPKLIIEVWQKNLAKMKALLDRCGYDFAKCSGFGEAQSQYYADFLCISKTN